MSPDGKMLAVGCLRGEIEILDPISGERKQNWRVPGEVTGFAFRPGSSELAVTLRVERENQRPRVFRYNLNGMKPLEPLLAGLHADETPAYSPDGSVLATGAFDGVFRSWDVSGPEPKTGFTFSTPLFPRGLQGVAWTPEGRHVAVGTQSGAVLVFRFAEGPVAAADPDRAAVAWLLRRGAEFGFNDANGYHQVTYGKKAVLPAGPIALSDFKLSGAEFTIDADLSQFRGLKHLGTVVLVSTSLSDVGLEHVAKLPGLEKLYASGAKLTDAGLKHLQEAKILVILHLDGTAVTDAGLEYLAGLFRLADLHLHKTKVTESGVKKLAKALPQCKIIWDGGTIEPKKN